jgi:hypothetical protein
MQMAPEPREAREEGNTCPTQAHPRHVGGTGKEPRSTPPLGANQVAGEPRRKQPHLRVWPLRGDKGPSSTVCRDVCQ